MHSALYAVEKLTQFFFFATFIQTLACVVARHKIVRNYQLLCCFPQLEVHFRVKFNLTKLCKTPQSDCSFLLLLLLLLLPENQPNIPAVFLWVGDLEKGMDGMNVATN